MISPELRWLFQRLRPLRPLIFAQLCAALVGSVLGLLDPLIIKWLIDDILPWQKGSMLGVAAGAFFAVYFFRFGFNSLGLLLDTYLAQRLMLGLRLHLLRHLLGLSNRYFVETPPGDIVHRLEQDVNQIQELGGGHLGSLVRIAISTSFTVVILMILSWKLTLMVLPLLPLVLWLRNFAYPRLRKASDEVNRTSAARQMFFQDLVYSVPQVQLLRREAGERRRFVGIARDGLEQSTRRRGLELFLGHSTNMAMIFGTALVLGYGGSQVMAGTLTVGGLVAFYTYLTRIFGPTQTLVSLYSALQRAQASLRRLMDFLAVRSEISNTASPLPIPGDGPLEASLEDVHLAYGEAPILRGANLTLRSGTRAALVGTTGGGKSTLVRLLVRLQDPDSGRVLLNGITASRFDLRRLRQQVALVMQEPLLFDGTIRENLLYAAPNASEEDLWEALTTAQLTTTLRELEGGLDAPVGVRGQKLSGGQKQRLAIARAILQRPRLLILDEATAALDAVTEQRLLRALEPLAATTTILLIAHRISAIRWAQEVFVLEDGIVTDHGSHEQLHQRSGTYRDLCHRTLQEEGDEVVEGLEEGNAAAETSRSTAKPHLLEAESA